MMKSKQPKIVKPKVTIGNAVLYWIGLSFLALAKIKNMIVGYKTPRTFSITEYEMAVEYDNNVVVQWLEFLELYTDGKVEVTNKVVLELGPGADLGVGLILLSKGALKYNALDVNNLVDSVPAEFYDKLFRYIESSKAEFIDVSSLRNQLELTMNGQNDRLNYICSEDFNIKTYSDEKFDIVFSQAAFEHFEDMERTIRQLSSVVDRGSILIAEVDLKTHSRWIRDIDPLNIYRFHDFTYDLFKYPGQPNRLRPIDYQRILVKNGWEKIRIYPLSVLEKGYLSKVRCSLNKAFHDLKQDMGYLSVMICAVKN